MNPQPFWRRPLTPTPALAALTLLLAGAAHATPLSPAERAYVGGYTQSGRETVSQLVLLDDRSFCFMFMGGSVDHLAAGRWGATKGGKGVRLTEVVPSLPLFPAVALPAPSGSPPGVVFELDSHSLSEAEGAMFAVSATPDLPTRWRALFADMQSWASKYALPTMAPTDARWFFVGLPQTDASGRAMRDAKVPRMTVLQYELGPHTRVLIAHRPQVRRFNLDVDLSLQGQALSVNGRAYGRRKLLTAQESSAARAECVDPVLRAAQDPERALGVHQVEGAQLLRPVRVFELEEVPSDAGAWIRGGAPSAQSEP